MDGAAASVDAAVQNALDQEMAVIVFPAGEVSRLSWQGVRDGAPRAPLVWLDGGPVSWQGSGPQGLVHQAW